MIVCLGWGSLIWDHRELPINGYWRNDGPSLPIEFARQSRDGRITLVIADECEPVPVLWTAMDLDTLDEARRALAGREGISAKYIEASVGFWCDSSRSSHDDAPVIGAWGRGVGASGVVWTALRPRFGGKTIKPSCDEVLAYLAGLNAEKKQVAEQYIRRVPRQIRTHYRDVIERELGWTIE